LLVCYLLLVSAAKLSLKKKKKIKAINGLTNLFVTLFVSVN